MATHSCILLWRILWTEEPGRLQSMGSQRVREDWVTNTFTSLSSSLKQKSLTGGVEGGVGLDFYLVWWLAMCLLMPTLKWMPWLSKHKSGTCIMKRKVNCQGLPYSTINAQPSKPWEVRQGEVGFSAGFQLWGQRPLRQISPLPLHFGEGFWKDNTSIN